MKAGTTNRKIVLETILNQITTRRFGAEKMNMSPGEIIREVEKFSVKTGISKRDMDFTVGDGRQLFINGTYICTM